MTQLDMGGLAIQLCIQLFGNKNRAMAPTRAANGDGQIIFSFFRITRNQGVQQMRQVVEKALKTVILQNKVGYRFVAAA
jgi:hypothetical protein